MDIETSQKRKFPSSFWNRQLFSAWPWTSARCHGHPSPSSTAPLNIATSCFRTSTWTRGHGVFWLEDILCPLSIILFGYANMRSRGPLLISCAAAGITRIALLRLWNNEASYLIILCSLTNLPFWISSWDLYVRRMSSPVLVIFLGDFWIK